MAQKKTCCQSKRASSPHYGRGFSDAIRYTKYMDDVSQVSIERSNALDYVWYAKYDERSQLFEDYFNGLSAGFNHVCQLFAQEYDKGVSWTEFKATAL